MWGGDKGGEVWHGLDATEQGNRKPRARWGNRVWQDCVEAKAPMPWFMFHCPTGLHVIKHKVKNKIKNFKKATAWH